MDITKITDKFIAALDDHGYEDYYTRDAVESIVKTSLERKAHLIELFRTSKKWDEDQLCIHFDHDVERKTEPMAYSRFLRFLSRETHNQIEAPALAATGKSVYAVDRGDYNPLLKIIHNWTNEESSWGGGIDLYETLSNLPSETTLPAPETMDSESAKWYLKYLSFLNDMDEKFNFRPGMKLNRVINKICQKFELDKLEGYNRAFAAFSDGITPLTISRHTTISVNPVDFLLMSNGNSWRSCHYIGDDPEDAGCYCSGTVSYMMAEDTFIVSIIDKEWPDNNLAFAPKINRQVFGYRDGQLVQSRLYPQDCDSGASEVYRNLREMVEEIIANGEDVPNRWVKDSNFNTEARGTAYTDWYHFSSCGQYSIRDYMLDKQKEKVRMSKLPMCIKCGSVHSDEEHIYCEEDRHYCEECGCWIDLDDEDSYVEYDGYYYCTNCRFICAKCGEAERVSSRIWISDREEDWCEWCAERYAFTCDKCGETFADDEMTDLESGDHVCSDCLEWYCKECEVCGKIDYKRYMVEHDGKWYCEECAENVSAGEEESA